MIRKLVVLGLVGVALGACASKDQKNSIARANEGEKARDEKRYDEAASKFNEAVKLDDHNFTAYYNLGLTYDAMKKYDDAAKAYEKAVQLNGKDPMFHMKHGIALYNAAVIEAAKAVAASSTDTEKNDPSEIDPDTLDLKSANLDPAVQELQNAVNMNPGLFRAYYYLGMIYAHTDDPAKAADAWTQSIKSNARFAQPYAALGKLYIAWGDYPEALQVLKAGKDNLPGDPQRPVVLYTLGLAYYLQKDYANAIPAFSDALEADKNLHLALYQRGMAYMHQKDFAHAKTDLEQYSKNAKDEYLKGVAQKALMDIMAASAGSNTPPPH